MKLEYKEYNKMKISPLLNINNKYNKAFIYNSKATVSFSGIKVADEDENEKYKSESIPHSQRRTIIDNLKFKFGIYKEQDELLKNKNIKEKIWNIDKNSTPITVNNNREKEFNEKMKLLKEHEASLDKRKRYAGNIIVEAEKLSDEVSKFDVKNKLQQQNITADLQNKYIDISRKKGMSKIAGYEQEQSTLFDVFIDKVNAEKKGEDVKVPGSILFFGPSGNGKTYITNAVAEEADCGNVVEIITNSKSKVSQEKAMKRILDEAQKAEEKFKQDQTRTIIFIDEIKNLASKNSKILPELEDFLNNCSKKYHCTLFAATNDPLELGFDRNNNRIFPIVFAIDPPDKHNSSKLFEYYLNGISEGEFDSEKLANELLTKGKENNGRYNNKQICKICEDCLQKKESNITQDDVLEYIRTMVIDPRINAADMVKFKTECDNYIK